MGPEAKGLSANVVGRLNKKWQSQYPNRCQPSCHDDWVQVWEDGIYSALRGVDGKLCHLVVIGLNSRGNKHLSGAREWRQKVHASWPEALRSLQQQGQKRPPKLAIGDAAMGFWAALDEVYAETITQRRWMHKSGHVLNYLQKTLQEISRA